MTENPNQAKCPKCGEMADYDLQLFPPELEGDENGRTVQIMPYLCPNGHRFVKKRLSK